MKTLLYIFSYFRKDTVLTTIMSAANPAIQISNIILLYLFTVNTYFVCLSPSAVYFKYETTLTITINAAKPAIHKSNPFIIIPFF